MAETKYVHKFTAPVEYEGKKIESIAFDFGKLTGRDGIAVETELTMMGIAVVSPSISGAYLMRMACRASEPRVGMDFMELIPIKDYHEIRKAVRNFL